MLARRPQASSQSETKKGIGKALHSILGFAPACNAEMGDRR
jgi:hypothetical protein